VIHPAIPPVKPLPVVAAEDEAELLLMLQLKRRFQWRKPVILPVIPPAKLLPEGVEEDEAELLLMLQLTR
jgi:hypothetical protein